MAQPLGVDGKFGLSQGLGRGLVALEQHAYYGYGYGQQEKRYHQHMRQDGPRPPGGHYLRLCPPPPEGLRAERWFQPRPPAAWL